MAEEKKIGKITHYFGKIGVGVIEVNEGELKVGDTIHIKGGATDFDQKVESMQVDKDPISEITKGQSAGLKVSEPVKNGDEVFIVA